MAIPVILTVNGDARHLALDPRVSILDALRDHLGVMSVKKGCDHGQCGACTVLLDGRRVLSCLALAVSYDGADIVTAEGLGGVDALHPMQQRLSIMTDCNAAIARRARSVPPSACWGSSRPVIPAMRRRTSTRLSP